VELSQLGPESKSEPEHLRSTVHGEFDLENLGDLENQLGPESKPEPEPRGEEVEVEVVEVAAGVGAGKERVFSSPVDVHSFVEGPSPHRCLS
jgi:hypothetical protein